MSSISSYEPFLNFKKRGLARRLPRLISHHHLLMFFKGCKKRIADRNRIVVIIGSWILRVNKFIRLVMSSPLFYLSLLFYFLEEEMWSDRKVWFYKVMELIWVTEHIPIFKESITSYNQTKYLFFSCFFEAK